jgi:hypothetical protein
VDVVLLDINATAHAGQGERDEVHLHAQPTVYTGDFHSGPCAESAHLEATRKHRLAAAAPEVA